MHDRDADFRAILRIIVSLFSIERWDDVVHEILRSVRVAARREDARFMRIIQICPKFNLLLLVLVIWLDYHLPLFFLFDCIAEMLNISNQEM